MSTVDTLAEFVASFPNKDIPEASLSMAEDCVLDAIGAGAAGFGTGGAEATRSVAAALFGNGPATVWFTGSMASQVGAAFPNSMAMSALDIDDGHRATIGHPGACAIPAAFATAEATGVSGLDMLAAVVMGIEVAVRLTETRNMETHQCIATGRWGGLVAAAAAGRLRGLAPDRLAQALLIAENHGPGLLASQAHGFGGAHVKEGIAWSVVTGFIALDLAEAGFTGYPNTFDLPYLYDESPIIEDLGASFAIDRTYFKPYSCCRAVHSAIDALLALMEEENLAADEMESVRVDGCAVAYNLTNHVDPPNFEAAQFSIPFGLAIAAVDGAAALQPLKPRALGRTELVDFAKRVTLNIDPELDALFPRQVAQRVTIKTGRGTFEKLVEHPLGEPANPYGREGLRTKFRNLTSPMLSPERQERVIADTGNLRSDGLATLLEELRSPLD